MPYEGLFKKEFLHLGSCLLMPNPFARVDINRKGMLGSAHV